MSKAFSTGVKPVYKLKTQLGRTIRATGNHRFLTMQGWKRLDELIESQHIALPRIVPESQHPSSSQLEKLALLGHLMGDGCTLPSHAIQYTTREDDLADIGTAYSGMTIFKQNMSRERAQRVATAVNSQPLHQLANSDVYWDKIDSIIEDGIEEVFDLTVPGPHNFIANNIIVHNSIEQDADIVMFIYRDEYYNPETTERPNIAELNIAKHRNGPTGTVDLYWHGKLATFRNLHRQEINL